MGAVMSGCFRSSGAENNDDAAPLVSPRQPPPPQREADDAAAPPPSPSNSAPTQSVFYDARSEMTKSMIFNYPPATMADHHPRNSIVMTEPATLLSTSKEPTSVPSSKGNRRRRSSLFVRKSLEAEERVVETIHGYPGELNQEELEATLKFRKRLLDKDPVYTEMVLCFEGVEEEPYALCRFMRARKFDVDKVMEMMEPCVTHWQNAKAHDFYPTVEDAVNCDASVFLTQYPYLFAGNAKNGAPVMYFMAGRLQLEGIECVTDLPKINNYAWNTVMHQFKTQLAVAQKSKPHLVVRCENIVVLDLKGLGSSQLNQTALDVMSRLGEVSSCFPELLNQLVILNAPYYFTVFWPMIKSFMDPRTVSKFHIFSNEKKGNKKLAELIAKEELLSNYGGKGPSFDEMAQKQQEQSGGGASTPIRQAVKLFSMKPGYEGNWWNGFELSASEQAKITVYSRSADGATVTLFKGKKKQLETIQVKSDVSTQQDTTTSSSSTRPDNTTRPYSVQLATEPKGPGKFSVVAKSLSNETLSHFLVFVQVFAC